jgi:hypothetical protein
MNEIALVVREHEMPVPQLFPLLDANGVSSSSLSTTKERHDQRSDAAIWAGKAGAKKAVPKAKRKGGMSAEARKAQGERMKEYWAKRRQQKAGTAEGPQGEAATANGSGKSTGKASQKRRNK